MNIEILKEAFKTQLSEGLAIAPFLVAGSSVKEDEFSETDNIFDSSSMKADDMTVEGKKKCKIVRLYANLADLDTLALVLYDTEFLKMQDGAPIFRTSSKKMKIETLNEAFKDQIANGLEVASYFIESHIFKNEKGESRVNIAIKQANLSNLENLAESLVDKTFLRIDNNIPVFGMHTVS
jgi:hypothetical protein